MSGSSSDEHQQRRWDKDWIKEQDLRALERRINDIEEMLAYASSVGSRAVFRAIILLQLIQREMQEVAMRLRDVENRLASIESYIKAQTKYSREGPRGGEKSGGE